MLDEFSELLILAYFKEYKDDYSLFELKELLGVSFESLDNGLEELIHDEQLCLNDRNLLSLTHKGRIRLMDSGMENYSFKQDNTHDNCEVEKWPLTKPYCVHDFAKFKWRGSEK